MRAACEWLQGILARWSISGSDGAGPYAVRRTEHVQRLYCPELMDIIGYELEPRFRRMKLGRGQAKDEAHKCVSSVREE